MTNETEEISDDLRIALQALYELSLEACGGNKELLDSLPIEEYPKILEEDLYKRYIKLGGKE